MDSRTLAAIARGNGLATTRQLVGCGIDVRQIARWVRTHRLVVVRRGVYTTAELWESWDALHDRPLARVRAVDLTLQVPHVRSHDSAALLWGIPLIRPQDAGLHVTRRHLRASTTKAGVRHHGARYGDHRATEVAGLTTLDIPRTVADLAREHGYLAGLVAADGALQLGISRAELAAVGGEMTGWPHSLVVQACIAAADPGAESVLESLARDLLQEAGLGPVETQFPVAIPGGVAYVDLRVGRHLFEADGRIKFVPFSDGGVARDDPRNAVWQERRRQQQVCGDVFGMTRLTWADMWGAARERAKQRARADVATTERRYGRELPADVAQFAAKMRGRRSGRAGLSVG